MNDTGTWERCPTRAARPPTWPASTRVRIRQHSQKLNSGTDYHARAGIQSAGAAVWWALDSSMVSYNAIFGATWGMLAGALLIGAPVIFLRIKDTTEIADDIAGTGEAIEDVAAPGQLAAEEKKAGVV